MRTRSLQDSDRGCRDQAVRAGGLGASARRPEQCPERQRVERHRHPFARSQPNPQPEAMRLDLDEALQLGLRVTPAVTPGWNIERLLHLARNLLSATFLERRGPLRVAIAMPTLLG
jgi:hypothetical protein